jgi:N-methylhydantoinase A
MYRVCIDVGGTFTDCLVLYDGQLTQVKSPTTYPDPSVGFMDVLEKAAGRLGRGLAEFLGDVELITHGTTLATNTLINENGATVGMITTKDFRDAIEIRRGYKNVRTSMYNVFIPPYKPLARRRHRLEARERVDYTGAVITPLDVDDVRTAAATLAERGVESLAVCFLHSYANPDHERRAAEIAQEVLGEDAYVTSSSDILPVWREWERFNTTVVSAYVGPEVKRYLRSLVERLNSSGFTGHIFMMLSDGLVETIDYCIPRAVYLIGSGPAAAPAAAVYVGALGGESDLLSFDMGGTSIDFGLIRKGQIPTNTENWVDAERIATKMIDIHSAGAGGGSIAWVDQLGLLRVGPHSAGSTPGPACYGRGGDQPTVTDADLVLGYVSPDFFLGGEMELDADAAEEAIRSKVAEPLGMSVPEAAQAILSAVSSFMADQITEVSTRRGYDHRDAVFVAGGGAGPVHGPFIAKILGIRRVIIPSIAATYSAFGMFAMDSGRNFARSYIDRADTIDAGRIEELYESMEQQAREAFAAVGIAPEQITFHRSADLRYIGQFHEVEVDVPDGDIDRAFVAGAVDNFHQAHEELYTFNMRWKAVEFLTFRLRATTPRMPFELRRVPEAGADAEHARKHHRPCWWDGEQIDTPIYDGSSLLAGNVIDGPALIDELTTSVVIPGGYRCEVDAWRNYQLTQKD